MSPNTTGHDLVTPDPWWVALEAWSLSGLELSAIRLLLSCIWTLVLFVVQRREIQQELAGGGGRGNMVSWVYSFIWFKKHTMLKSVLHSEITLTSSLYIILIIELDWKALHLCSSVVLAGLYFFFFCLNLISWSYWPFEMSGNFSFSLVFWNTLRRIRTLNVW